MYKLGIIGYPLAHSLSPTIHGAALKYLNLDGQYSAFEVAPKDLIKQVEYFKANNFSGFNITIPHKVSIIEFLEYVDTSAKAVGAVNTVQIKDGKLYGYNTDIYGFVNGIKEELQAKIKGKKCALLGAGGAARAVLAGLIDLGAVSVDIYARNIDKAKDLISSFNDQGKSVELVAKELKEQVDLSDVILLVNTTPLGMFGRFEAQSPVNEESIVSMPKDAIVYDIVYKPEMTRLLEYAAKQDLAIVKGLDMLILQGAKGFEIWTGQKPPVEVMKKAAKESLYNE